MREREKKKDRNLEDGKEKEEEIGERNRRREKRKKTCREKIMGEIEKRERIPHYLWK